MEAFSVEELAAFLQRENKDEETIDLLKRNRVDGEKFFKLNQKSSEQMGITFGKWIIVRTWQREYQPQTPFQPQVAPPIDEDKVSKEKEKAKETEKEKEKDKRIGFMEPRALKHESDIHVPPPLDEDEDDEEPLPLPLPVDPKTEIPSTPHMDVSSQEIHDSLQTERMLEANAKLASERRRPAFSVKEEVPSTPRMDVSSQEIHDSLESERILEANARMIQEKNQQIQRQEQERERALRQKQEQERERIVRQAQESALRQEQERARQEQERTLRQERERALRQEQERAIGMKEEVPSTPQMHVSSQEIHDSLESERILEANARLIQEKRQQTQREQEQAFRRDQEREQALRQEQERERDRIVRQAQERALRQDQEHALRREQERAPAMERRPRPSPGMKDEVPSTPQMDVSSQEMQESLEMERALEGKARNNRARDRRGRQDEAAARDDFQVEARETRERDRRRKESESEEVAAGRLRKEPIAVNLVEEIQGPSVQEERHFHEGNDEMDTDDEPEDFAALDEQNLTQADRPREASGGVIEMVELVNFMNHKNFRMAFGPQINFVTGPNGSGKSALLTAITVCLGGKAVDTQRASSVKNFIKTGERAAEVIVTLRNQGDEAFRHDLYGDSIKVKRIITPEGGRYELRSAKDKVISKKREDLDEILDHFIIQVDNPIVILTQDKAREFLATGTDTEKYSFFMKGTQLEQVSVQYHKVRDEIHLATEILKEKQPGVIECHKEVVALKRKLKDMEGMREVDENIQQVSSQLIWGDVIEKEKRVAQLKKEIQEVESRVSAMNDATAEMEDGIKLLDDDIKKANDKKVEIMDLKAAKEAEIAQIRDGLKSEDKQLRILKEEEADIHSQVKVQDRTIHSLDSRYSEEQEKLAANTQEHRAHMARQLANLREYIGHASAEVASLESARISTETEKTQCAETLEKLESEAAELKNLLQRGNSHLRNLQDTKNNALSSYGRNIPAVLKQLEAQSHSFERPVIGPIGRYLKLKDQKWQGAVEAVIGSLLPDFVVQTFRDSQLLKRILRDHHCDNAVVIREDWRRPAMENLPGREYTTVLDVLESSQEVVLLQLIDVRDIERTILLRDFDEAAHVMYEVRPRNVDSAFTMEGEKVSMKGTSRSYMNYKSWKSRGSFGNVDNDIRRVNEELQANHRRLQEIEPERERCRAAQVARENRNRALISDVKRKKQELERREQEANDLQEKLAINMPSQLAAIEDEKKEAEETREILMVQYRETSHRLQAVQTKMEPQRRLIRELTSEISGLNQRNQDISAVVDEIVTRRGTSENQKANHLQKKKKFEDAMSKKADDLATFERELQTATSNALAHAGPRLEVETSMSKLQSMLKTLKRRKADNEKEFGGNVEDVVSQLERKREKLREMKVSVTNLRTLLQRLNRALDKRNHRWLIFRTLLSQRAQNFFRSNLRNRGYSGSLKVNHEDKTLKLHVQTNEQKHQKNTKQLSGGERSFSTISFLLALWEAMESPFRVLDEYDVFMDSVNRRISTRMIIEAARCQPNHQFIMISPQDMANIDTGDDINVARMPDPERG